MLFSEIFREHVIIQVLDVVNGPEFGFPQSRRTSTYKSLAARVNPTLGIFGPLGPPNLRTHVHNDFNEMKQRQTHMFGFV